MAAPWKKLPSCFRVWEDWMPEEDDEEDGGGDGGDEGGDEGGGDGGDEGGDGGGGGDEGGGEEGGGGGEETGFVGDEGEGGGGGFEQPSWDSGGDTESAWGGEFDSDGDGLDDNAVQTEWQADRAERERQFDEESGRDDFERELERQQQEAEDERRRQEQEAFDRQLEENQRIADAFRAQEVAANLPQIGQPVPNQTAQLLGTLQQANQGSTTVPPGWSGLFSPPVEAAPAPPPEPERPLERGAPPPAGSALSAADAADWVARGINPITGEPIERAPVQAEARPNPDTLFPPEQGNPPIQQAPARPNPDTLFPPERGNPPIPQAPARPNPDTLFPPGYEEAPSTAATTAAAGAAAAGASPAQVAATAEQAARIVWDNQTLAQQTPWTRAAFRSQYGENAEAEWQRQHRAELARNVALYGSQEPVTGFRGAPERRIGAIRPPGPGETAMYGETPRRVTPAVTAAAAAAPAAAAASAAAAPAAAKPPEQAPAPAQPAAQAATTTTAPSTGTGWTPLPGQGPARPPVKLPPTPPLQPVEPPEPAKPYTPWRPAAPGAAPGEPGAPAAPGEPGTPAAPAAPAEIIDTRAADEGPREATENVVNASLFPEQPVPMDPTAVKHVGDLSRDAHSVDINGLTTYVEPTGAMFTETPGAEHLLQYRGTSENAYAQATPINTVVAVTENGTVVRFSERDWGWMAPEQQSRYTQIRTEPLPPRGPGTQPSPPKPVWVDPALTAPGVIKRTASTNQTMNNLIRGTSPVMVAGMANAEAMTEEAPLGGTPTPLPPTYRPPQSDLPTASLPASSGPAINPITGEPTGVSHETPEMQRAVADPFGTIVNNAGQLQGSQDLAGFRASVAGGMVKGEAWTEPYMNDMARMAWYRESGGREGAPQDAPTSYIEAWKNMWKSGSVDGPGMRELNQSLVQAGQAPPSAAVAPLGPPKYPLTAIVPNQYTDPEVQKIPGWQFDAACGITAGMGMARMIGLDPTAKDFLAAAQKHGGWTAGAGMGGTAGEVKMLEAMGVPVVAQYNARGEYIPERATPQAVDAELAAGRPVILDTSGSPGHYFAIVGKTPDGYIVSGSGTALKRGAPIMTQQQMENAMGPWRNLVRLDTSRLPQGAAQQQQAPTTRMATTADVEPANMNTRFTEPDVRAMQDDIIKNAPQIQITPGQGSMEDRIAQVMPAAEWLEKKYGYPAEVLVGLMVAENGVGQVNSPAVQGNNYFSLEYNKLYDKLATGYAPNQGSDPRWAAYRTINEALARKIGIFAHPENTNYARAWAARGDPEKLIDGLIAGGYIVNEPGKGNSIPEWRARLNTGRALYRKVKAARGGR